MEGANSPDNHIRLACQACQRKKIKCDRNYPCTQCIRSNLQCVASSRKPRARHVGKRAVDSELRSRISKLENLVENLSGEVASANGGANQVEAQSTESPAVGKYIGSHFWSSLTGEVQALKDALEDEQPEEEEEPTSPTTFSGQGNSAEYDLLLCPPGVVYVMPGALQEPPPHIAAALCDVYCTNVNGTVAIFHRPTLRALIVEGKPYLGRDPSTPGNRAVKAAVCFGATVTLTESQCQMMFGKSQQEQLRQFRKMVDVAIAQADLFTTTDLATMQAFAAYIMTARRFDSSRRSWTMAALLVRIARAMGLHYESISRSPFETELRRRLWMGIRFIDMFTGWDRGNADLLIPLDSEDTPRPRNINDTDFDESSTSIPEDRIGATDATFGVISHGAIAQTHRFSSPESKPGGGDTWEDRLAAAKKFEEDIAENFGRHFDSSIPFQRFLANVFPSMTKAHKLRAARPLKKHPASTAPKVDSPYILELALDSLTAADRFYGDPSMEAFSWMTWVPWHPLAVALAGLCGIRDTALAHRAWDIVEKAYARTRKIVADTETGMLWRPIEKLHRKARAFREHREESPSDTTSPLQNPHPPPVYTAPNQIDPSLVQTQTQTQTQAPFIPGTMPIDGVLNNTMNVDFGNTVMSDIDLSNSNMNWWMDFQNIFDDMSAPEMGVVVNNPTWMGNTAQTNGGWDGVFPTNTM